MYYKYEELKTKAIKNRTPESVNALAEWFQEYGSMYWNGEYYDVDENNRLFPIYTENSDGEYDITGWELK